MDTGLTGCFSMERILDRLSTGTGETLLVSHVAWSSLSLSCLMFPRNHRREQVDQLQWHFYPLAWYSSIKHQLDGRRIGRDRMPNPRKYHELPPDSCTD
jgi:hypothetical protein